MRTLSNRVFTTCSEDVHTADTILVRLFIDPTVVLVSTKIDDTVIDRLDPEARSDTSVHNDDDPFRLPFVLQVRPQSEFYYDAAKRKLVSLHLGEESSSRVSFNVPGESTAVDHIDDEGSAGQQEQMLRLAGWIDLESRTTV